MNILAAEDIGKRMAGDQLFKEVSLGIARGQKAALIGVNGCGKSTLLRILAGVEEADSGRVVRNKELRTAFLSQEPEFNPEHDILRHVLAGEGPMVALIRDYRAAVEAVREGGGETAQNNLAALEARMDSMGAWNFESEVSTVLAALGLKELNRPMGSLSGGMLKKVALAAVLVDDADLILLDEPTNHLDMDTIIWLEERLKKTTKAVVLITHDRYFLDHVVDKIYEIDEGELVRYDGSYEYYLEHKELRDQERIRDREKARNTLRKELEWLGRQPKARGTKQKARIQRIDDILKRARGSSRDEFAFSVSERRLGKRILEAEELSKSFGDASLFTDFTHFFKAGERIGLVGPNGSGKTTFLRILSGSLNADSGEIRRGSNTVFGIFDQLPAKMSEDRRVIDYVRETAGARITMADGSSLTADRMLDYFHFDGRLKHSFIHRLSGGERRRLQLVMVLMANPNFLILDEPTNDLDVQTLSLLEDFLERFAGCLLVVSHDRYFMDRVIDSLFVFGSGEISPFPGNCTDYLMWRTAKTGVGDSESSVEPEQASPNTSDNRKDDRARKLSNRERAEFASLEGEIEQLEEEKGRLEAVLSGGGDYKEVAEAGQRHGEVELLIKEKIARWTELADRPS